MIELRNVFEEQIPAALGKNPTLASEVNTVVQFDISGPGGGAWILDLTRAESWVSSGRADKPGLTICATDADFVKVLAGTISGAAAVMSGKLTFKPMNIALATKLSNVLRAGRA
jgi:putative sterol carrier protein